MNLDMLQRVNFLLTNKQCSAKFSKYCGGENFNVSKILFKQLICYGIWSQVHLFVLQLQRVSCQEVQWAIISLVQTIILTHLDTDSQPQLKKPLVHLQRERTSCLQVCASPSLPNLHQFRLRWKAVVII